MAKVCQLCLKWSKSWNNRSHSNRATKRSFKPNIINKNFDLWDWFKARVKLCASCYKRMVSQWQL